MRSNLMVLQKYELEEDILLAEVLKGLQKPQKELPCKLFYDEKGSALFDEICELDEYYLTRTEISIMNKYIDEISTALGKKCLLIELGSGSSIKIRLMLDHLEEPAAYVPIDISAEHLMKSVATLAMDYPKLKIVPVHTDYTQPFSLPLFNFPYSRKVVYYPGSTIGNFTKEEARHFLKQVAKLAGRGSGLLIGVDLKKDKKTLEAAYNDKKGVTAEFNLNILERLNNELGADLKLANWRHRAIYNSGMGRIEMHLISRKNQHIRINGSEILFKRNESILTEYSYKYTIEEFRQLVRGVFRLEHVWTDDENKFSVQYLTVL
ncbi:MAG TPA: L-histidine N(alpha)-methyltransferase [Thermodesulfobacteriota bacterium]|nr:L-histidine N(alpha)-methyltransferase [Thermodesulfobacteriota bacterium]